MYLFLLFKIWIIFFMFSFYFFMLDLTIYLEWEIINLNSCSIMMTILFDWMSLLFMSFVLFISSLVILYSKEYMVEDFQFILLILLFVFSMMMMIVSPNLISILLGWDGLGLVSYCLMIFFVSIMTINNFSILSLSDENWLMLKAMLILTFFSIVGGSMLSWMIFPYFSIIILPFYLKFLTLLICIFGGLFGYFFYSIFIIYKNKFMNYLNYLMFFVSMMWFMPILSTFKLNNFFLKNSELYFKNFDFGWSEMMGGIFFYKISKPISFYLEKLNYNQLKNILVSYLIMILLLFYMFV